MADITGLPMGRLANVPAGRLVGNLGAGTGWAQALTQAQVLAWLDVDTFSGDWADLTGKPATFPPSSHTHTAAAITDFPAAVAANLPGTVLQAGANVSSLVNDAGYITGYTVTEADVTAHQAALSITESQITDLGNYAPATHTHTVADLVDYVPYTDTMAINAIAARVAASSTVVLQDNGSNLQATIVAGSIGTTQLAPAVVTSLGLADSAVQPGAGVSSLANDAGYLTDAPSDGSEYVRLNGAWAVASGGGGTVAWADITGKPSTYPPAFHVHNYTEITGFNGAVDARIATQLSDQSTLQPYLAPILDDTATIEWASILGQDLQASVVAGSIGATQLATAVNNSLALADSAVQPSNFLAQLLANTSNSHTIELADYNGKLEARIENQSVEITKLAPAVVTSLGLADSAVQPGDNVSGLTNDAGYITSYTVTQADVTAHEAALTITESQISDLGAYLTDAPSDGSEYVRLNGAWAVASGGSAFTPVDSPTISWSGSTASVVAGSIDSAQLALPVNQSLSRADTAMQSGDIISLLTNDAQYIADAPSDSAYYLRRNAVWVNITGSINNANSALQPGDDTLTHWDEAETTTVPNGTVPVNSFTTSGTAANIDAALVPKGTGAILAAVPDSTAAGGNKRGINAVDLQTDRLNATDVASGEHSVIAGGLRNEASGDLSIVLGGQQNASKGTSTAVLGGNANTVEDVFYGTVLNGFASTVSADYSSILGGRDNTASGVYAVVVGRNNTASEPYALVGGINNTVDSAYGFVLNGAVNTVTVGSYNGVLSGSNNASSANYAVIASGSGNTASGIYSFIAGRDCIASGDYAVAHGNNNDATALGSAVLSGANTVCAANYAVVAGGASNEITASSTYAGVLAGANNDVTSPNGFIGAGQQNLAAGIHGGIAAGLGNSMQGTHGFIGAGWLNSITGGYCFVGGGRGNVAQGAYALVCGGFNNDAIGNYTFVGGGRDNIATATFSAIPSGRFNQTTGDYSLATGYASVAEGNNSTATGERAKSRLLSAHAHAAGRFAQDGDAQYQRVILRGQSTAAGAVDLYINGVAAEMTMEEDSAWHFNIRVVCLSADGSIGGAWTTEGMIRKDGSAVPVFVGTPATTNLGKDDAGLDFAVSAQSPDILRLTGTAIAGTYNWVATVELTEVLV